MADFLDVRRRAEDVWRGFSYARALLRVPVTSADARAAVRARLAARSEVFLDTVERAVFAYPTSPFRTLLDAAGYDLSRLRGLVLREGVEVALRRLCQDGVYISIEEFKGIRPVVRGNRTFQFDEQDFSNPLAVAGFRASSGATRSQGVVTTIPTANHLMGAQHLVMAFDAYGLRGAPVAVWLPRAHGASLWAVLAFAAMRNAPQRWFTQIPGRFSSTVEPYSYYFGVKAGARLSGIKLPAQTYVPFGEEARILRWTGQGLGGQACAIFAPPSSALRLALAAKHSGTSLSNVTFITIGEPLTSAKLAAVRAVGARAFSSLGFTEFGRATYGCALPESPDDMHVCQDAVAVIQRSRSVDRIGGEVDALLFSTLQPDARRILLNVETGDYATMTNRRCGCLLEAADWTTHLSNVRSFEKLNAEGRLFFGSKLITLVEETLPARFGGDPTDYQLVEHEDKDGFTRVSILVHPDLGVIDERAILSCAEEALDVDSWESAKVWHEVGTLQILRAVPMLTKAGKLMPLHHLGPQQGPPVPLP